MSKKGKPTQVITITRSGDTVFANVTDVYSREVNGMTGAARCHPNDTFDFYEGARISLARAFGKEPFQVENKTADLETGRWVKAEIRKTGKVGDKILITDPWLSDGKYKAGDVFHIYKTDGEYGCWVDISENKANHSKHSETRAKTYLDNPRMVYLTRWSKPVRILTNAEVAEKYKEILSGTNIRVPFNVVTPGLLEELRRVGVAINDEGSPMYQHYAKKKAEKAESGQNTYTRYSITPEFEQWYKENYGVDGELTDAQLQRALQRQEQKTQRAEESAQAARTKAAVDAENTLTAWLIYHKKNMRRLSRDLQKKSADRVAELRREKAQALQDKELAWRIYHEAKIREQRAATQQAEKDIRKEMTQQKRDAVRTATEVERAKASVQRDADVMAFKRQAAKRLRIKDGQYTELKEKTREQTRLKRKAAERALKDSRQVAKKRAELEAKNGVVKTIRDIPAERKRIERLQERAANLKTLFRPAYAAFVNQAKAIDDFAKRQSGGVLSSTLVNVLGGSSTTIESVFKRGLVDRSGNRIGDAMKDVFLVWDGKKVDEAKQALLQDYMLHAHNVDRMSFVKNARARLENRSRPRTPGSVTWIRKSSQSWSP